MDSLYCILGGFVVTLSSRVYSWCANSGSGCSVTGGAEGPDRIFVGGLPYYFTEVQIRELLQTFGYGGLNYYPSMYFPSKMSSLSFSCPPPYVMNYVFLF